MELCHILKYVCLQCLAAWLPDHVCVCVPAADVVRGAGMPAITLLQSLPRCLKSLPTPAQGPVTASTHTAGSTLAPSPSSSPTIVRHLYGWVMQLCPPLPRTAQGVLGVPVCCERTGPWPRAPLPGAPTHLPSPTLAGSWGATAEGGGPSTSDSSWLHPWGVVLQRELPPDAHPPFSVWLQGGRHALAAPVRLGVVTLTHAEAVALKAGHQASVRLSATSKSMPLPPSLLPRARAMAASAAGPGQPVSVDAVVQAAGRLWRELMRLDALTEAMTAAGRMPGAGGGSIIPEPQVPPTGPSCLDEMWWCVAPVTQAPHPPASGGGAQPLNMAGSIDWATLAAMASELKPATQLLPPAAPGPAPVSALQTGSHTSKHMEGGAPQSLLEWHRESLNAFRGRLLLPAHALKHKCVVLGAPVVSAGCALGAAASVEGCDARPSSVGGDGEAMDVDGSGVAAPLKLVTVNHPTGEHAVAKAVRELMGASGNGVEGPAIARHSVSAPATATTTAAAREQGRSSTAPGTQRHLKLPAALYALPLLAVDGGRVSTVRRDVTSPPNAPGIPPSLTATGLGTSLATTPHTTPSTSLAPTPTLSPASTPRSSLSGASSPCGSSGSGGALKRAHSPLREPTGILAGDAVERAAATRCREDLLQGRVTKRAVPGGGATPASVLRPHLASALPLASSAHSDVGLEQPPLSPEAPSSYSLTLDPASGTPHLSYRCGVAAPALMLVHPLNTEAWVGLGMVPALVRRLEACCAAWELRQGALAGTGWV